MSNVDTKKAKLNYMTYFRAFAILMIVAGHTLCWGKYQQNIYYLNKYLFAGGTFLFIYIAGFLFQYLSYKFNYLDFLKKKFTNVIMPYFVTVFPFAIYFAITCSDIHNPFYYLSKLEKFIGAMFFGQVINLPLWFIPMITIFFIISPVFIHLQKNKTIWHSAIICSLIYTLISYRPITIGGLEPIAGKELLDLAPWYLQLYFKTFVYFLSTWLIGMASCNILKEKNEIIKKNSLHIILVSLTGYIFTYLVCNFYLGINPVTLAIPRFLTIMMFLGLTLYIEDYIETKVFLKKGLEVLADYSFGIFFIHFYIINFIYWHKFNFQYNVPAIFNIHKNTLHCCLHSIGTFLITVLLSITILFITKKILEILGIKNTRIFIGVGNNKKPKTLAAVRERERERVIPLLVQKTNNLVKVA